MFGSDSALPRRPRWRWSIPKACSGSISGRPTTVAWLASRGGEKESEDRKEGQEAMTRTALSLSMVGAALSQLVSLWF